MQVLGISTGSHEILEKEMSLYASNLNAKLHVKYI
jgi:hypothetical protein